MYSNVINILSLHDQHRHFPPTGFSSGKDLFASPAALVFPEWKTLRAIVSNSSLNPSPDFAEISKSSQVQSPSFQPCLCLSLLTPDDRRQDPTYFPPKDVFVPTNWSLLWICDGVDKDDCLGLSEIAWNDGAFIALHCHITEHAHEHIISPTVGSSPERKQKIK